MSRWPDPPRLAASFYKGHGLGNDYVVFEEGDDWHATPACVRTVCEAHRGVGADGVVVLLADRSDGIFRLRMFNPDGGEFERSGNGLRVLASHLARAGEPDPYTVEVGGKRLTLLMHANDRHNEHDVSVEMGRAHVGPEAVELDGRALDGQGRLPGPSGEALHIVPVSVGNPHIVALVDDPSEALLAELGPFLVAHPALAHGANVQLARTVDRNTCTALIWERGVGPTSASGTSACAVAVAMVSEERLPAGTLTVRMPGGEMTVTVSPDLDVVLRGQVAEVCTGALTDQFLARLGVERG